LPDPLARKATGIAAGARRTDNQDFTCHQSSAVMLPSVRRWLDQTSGSLHEREDQTVRKTLIALAVTTSLIGLTTVGTSAATRMPAPATDQVSAVKKADWYDCGPRCQYWHHRRAEEARHQWWREHEWREHHPYYGYNYYGYYR
jgi:hypothetical protein